MGNSDNSKRARILIVEGNSESTGPLIDIVSKAYNVITASPEDAFNLISDRQQEIVSAILYK